MTNQAQVSAKHYTSLKYLTLVRCITHWHQVHAVATHCGSGGKVLEIGPGTGHTTWMLEKIGYEVTTVDIAADTQPDIVGDVTKLDIGDDAFDVVLAAEVLEHIPFEQFETALRELRRVSRDRVIVTLPAPLVGLSVLINLPRISPFGLSLGAPYRRTHKFDGEHYWELGKKGYGKSRILEAIGKCRFERREFL